MDDIAEAVARNPESEPFGSPDGAAQDPGTFVIFRDHGQWRDLALRDDDRRARILVGRRGSGKSRYLRKMQVSVQQEGLLDYPQRDTKISLTNLRWLHRAFPDRADRLEIWELLWSCAVYAGVGSFLLNGPNRASSLERLSDRDREFLAKDAKRFIPPGPRDQPIVAVLNAMINDYRDKSQLITFVTDPIWNSIESIVLDAISTSTPLFAFIDALDDNYSDAPAASIDAQLGLVTWILRKIVDFNVGNRIHVVITVRDVVYAALLDGPNGQRYNDRQHIRCLDWDEQSSRYYLEHKISSLSKEFRAGPPKADSPFATWLGFSEIANPKRGDNHEKVADYILRHTRFLPREINEIGNNLSREIRGWLASKRAVDFNDVRNTVSLTARNIARNVIREMVLHLAALEEADGKQLRKSDDRAQLTAAVDAMITCIGKETFGPKELSEAELAFSELAPWWQATAGGHPLRIRDVLWQHGLLGYRKTSDPVRWVRYFTAAAGGSGDTTQILPRVDQYILHSAILDILPVSPSPIPPVAHAD